MAKVQEAKKALKKVARSQRLIRVVALLCIKCGDYMVNERGGQMFEVSDKAARCACGATQPVPESTFY